MRNDDIVESGTMTSSPYIHRRGGGDQGTRQTGPFADSERFELQMINAISFCDYQINLSQIYSNIRPRRHKRYYRTGKFLCATSNRRT